MAGMDHTLHARAIKDTAGCPAFYLGNKGQ